VEKKREKSREVGKSDDFLQMIFEQGGEGEEQEQEE